MHHDKVWRDGDQPMSVSAIYNMSCDWPGCESHDEHFAADVSKAGDIPVGWGRIELSTHEGDAILELCPAHLQEMERLLRPCYEENADA